ncbi:hypothetical protein BKA67DRAFT_322978 [Truncatella angustata]|uniref:Uncharacterized protein n=1 Tax=Truncatella angustata TaxID=152316 RepID=A0A9P8UK15_9PEZI|nr:uncharacterized protein BKA67DRAFT_322978 [Truncatella angustata]KAH6653519.1 hypothetical protein BKA67DRAFT_322978 [Truncatella angustata]
MHTRPQKIKMSRSGPSLKRKAKALGEKANVLSVLMYHNAIDNRMEMEVHVPKDLKKLPDFNKLVQRAIRGKDRKAQAHARALATPQPTSPIRSRTADHETSEERAQAVPLSIYDIIPDDDGDTVIVHDPSSAAGRQAHPGPSSGSDATGSPDSRHQRYSHRTESSATIRDGTDDNLLCYQVGQNSASTRKGEIRQHSIGRAGQPQYPSGRVTKQPVRGRARPQALETHTLAEGLSVHRAQAERQSRVSRVLRLLGELAGKSHGNVLEKHLKDS